jgi:tellurite resistance protein TerC
MVGADAVFGLDSIPAVYGVSDEPFVVFGANAFALLGLRPLFFLVSGLVRRLVYLPLAMAAVLAFIGVKLVLHSAHAEVAAVPTISTPISLAVIIALLGAATIASLVRTRSGQMRPRPHSAGAPEAAR